MIDARTITFEHYNGKYLKVGALVKKVYPHDGTIRSGKPYGETLVVLERKENPYWISCMNGIGKYFVLSDGDWAIEQNLKVV